MWLLTLLNDFLIAFNQVDAMLSLLEKKSHK